MRRLISITVILLIFLVFASCKDPRFDDIDFIAYSYRQVDSDNPKYQMEWKITCPFYLHIDNQYNCQLIKGKTFGDSTVKYYENKNDPELNKIVKEIITKAGQSDHLWPD